MNFYTVRVYLRSYDYIILNNLIFELKKLAKKHKVEFSGPVYLPTKKECFNILRSPHVNKNSRDQFFIFTHKRIIDFFVFDKKFILIIKNKFIFFKLNFNFKIIL